MRRLAIRSGSSVCRWMVLAALAAARTAAAQPARPPANQAAAELRRCDDLIVKRDLPAARICFERLRQQHPDTGAAHDADRSLHTITALASTDPGDPPSYFVLEPYSSRTHERLRLTSWEKLDFGVSAFIYGLSTGLASALATDASQNSAAGLMVAGAAVYTGLALAYVSTSNVDRGDLPLTLAITSYAPLTTALAALATQWTSPRAAGSAIFASAALSIPIAALVAKHTDLDPGDTQLVRDAGFWGLAASFVAADGITGNLQRGATAGLGGLYGGMALGLLAAYHSEISLERVRMTTWGGYGGALIGGLVASAAHAQQRTETLAIVGGSALGLLTTFLATSSADALPLPVPPRPLSMRGLEPTTLTLIDRNGRQVVQPGVTVVRGRF
jgi:hypothetical protein